MCVLSCVQLCDPVDCSPPGFSVHGVLQVRVLGWVAISFSRGSSRPRGQTLVSGRENHRDNSSKQLYSEAPGLDCTRHRAV